MKQAQCCKNRVKLSSTHKSHSHGFVTRGFTLIEVLIVLAIAALLSALTFAGFSSISNGHRRTSCQANMAQIYAAARQYAADEGGYFPRYDPTATTPEQRGIGLWTLYAFPSSTNYGEIAPPPTEPNPRPLERYIRSSKVLHCPADTAETNLLTANGTQYNANYLSYQTRDNEAAGGQADQETYFPTRTTNQSDTGWRRQLIHRDGTALVRRPPTDDTVVLWCPFHRDSGNTKLDNVLFYDGSVQVIPFNADTPAWLRNPKNPS